ncbi:hypothetical protein GGS26DRAFT_591511 [Hypomontagnella submonticulosa]|nr:hypothetical protein GGS26DRAFT_591511 [Hypomontagnella submonticulosa]
MCIQMYTAYVLCPCQMRGDFRPCEFGPSDPRCPGRRDIVSKTGLPYCTYHNRMNEKADAERLEFFNSRGRRMIPIPENAPVLGRRIGGRALQSAAATDYRRFPVDPRRTHDSDPEGPRNEPAWDFASRSDRDEYREARSLYFRRSWNGQSYWNW